MSPCLLRASGPMVWAPEEVRPCYRASVPAQADGRLIAYSARIEYVDTDGKRKKEVYPLTYCRVKNGERLYVAWRSCGVPAPRPLYNLPQLLASPNAPVIITEGERQRWR
jgi:hypothetical protein